MLGLSGSGFRCWFFLILLFDLGQMVQRCLCNYWGGLNTVCSPLYRFSLRFEDPSSLAIISPFTLQCFRFFSLHLLYYCIFIALDSRVASLYPQMALSLYINIFITYWDTNPAANAQVTKSRASDTLTKGCFLWVFCMKTLQQMKITRLAISKLICLLQISVSNFLVKGKMMIFTFSILIKKKSVWTW